MRQPKKARLLSLRVDETEMAWLDDLAVEAGVPRAAVVRAIFARAYDQYAAERGARMEQQ